MITRSLYAGPLRSNLRRARPARLANQTLPLHSRRSGRLASSKAIAVTQSPVTAIENIPAPTYDPTITFDTITRILSSGRATQKTLTNIALDLVTPAHRLTPGRRRLASLLTPPPTTTCGGMLNLGRIPAGEEFTLTKPITDDLYWWAGSLINGRARLAYPPIAELPRCPHVVYCDASGPGGVGLVVDKTWYHWPWTTSPCVNTSLAETLGVEATLMVLVTKYGTRNSHIRVITDCDRVIELWKQRKVGSGANVEANPVFERILRTLHNSNCWLELEKVDSSANLADKPSRGKTPGPDYTEGVWIGDTM